jgi:pteridine reductase
VEGPLTGRTALVTGGARRIGRAVSLALASSGAAVVVHYGRSVDEAQRVVEQIAARGGEALSLMADLARAEEAEALVERALRAAGRLDILVNNASIFGAEALEPLSLGTLMQDVQVNAWAPFVLTRAFARQVGRGSVVNLLDTRISGVDLAHPSYTLSKWLLFAMTRLTAIAYAPEVTVNAVAPGLILPPEGKDERYLAGLAGGVPLRRHGDPDDVARAVVFLVKSRFITGQVIFVDGGQHLLGGVAAGVGSAGAPS